MKYSILIITFLFTSKICFSQTDTTFFNSEWKDCKKSEAKFYRIVIKEKNGFIVKDMYINHKPQMIAVCSKLTNPLIKDGKCIFFDENGNKQIQGYYKNNEPIGTWVWYDNNGNDSTVATYQSDGTKAYSRFSRLELEKQKDDRNVYQLADEMPTFPGGQKALSYLFDKTFKILKSETAKRITGTFYLEIIINQDGSVSFSEIKKSLSPEYDEETKKMVKKMPNWTPGKIDNKTVKVKMTLPIKISE